eukprot:1295607-Rhodomonas_salina.1
MFVTDPGQGGAGLWVALEDLGMGEREGRLRVRGLDRASVSLAISTLATALPNMVSPVSSERVL